MNPLPLAGAKARPETPIRFGRAPPIWAWILVVAMLLLAFPAGEFLAWLAPR